MYETSLIDVARSWYIICFSYRWSDSKKTHTVALPDFPRYKKDKEDDSKLCKELWNLFDQADVIVAHNIKFDLKKAYARFIKHGYAPPSPSKRYCTLSEARKHFAFTSNRLNDLARYLLGSRKLPHSGWNTWRKVLAGDEKQWAVMRRYCARDTDLLYKLWLKLRAWSTSHTRVAPSQNCPACQSTKTQRRGVYITATGKHTKQFRYQCREHGCGHWFLR